jgi:hypothetical protein
MANKTEAVSPPLQLAEARDATELELLKDDVERVVALVDHLRKSSFRENLIRNEVANGALDMISGLLRMALNDL